MRLEQRFLIKLKNFMCFLCLQKDIFRVYLKETAAEMFFVLLCEFVNINVPSEGGHEVQIQTNTTSC